MSERWSVERERMTILYYLLFLMDIDGIVSWEEEDLLQEFGLHLGFRTSLTMELINEIKEHAASKMSEASVTVTAQACVDSGQTVIV